MYKRIIAAVIALMAAFALAACGSSDNKSVKLAEEAPAGAQAEASNDKIETPKAEEAADKEIKTDDAEKASDEDKDNGTDAENEEIHVPEGVVAPEKMLTRKWTGTIAADGDGLNLRSGPDSDYEEIDLIPDDTEVDILAEQDGWGLTTYRDQYGWIFLEWVEK